MFNKKFDFKLLKSKCFDAAHLGGWDKPAKYQILSLWTTFCLIHEIEPDTYTYDTKLREIWLLVLKQVDSQSRLTTHVELKTFDDFDEFMCQNLV